MDLMMTHPLINQIFDKHNDSQGSNSSRHWCDKPKLIFDSLNLHIALDLAILPPNPHINHHRVHFNPLARDFSDSSGRYQQVCRLDMSLQRVRVGVQHCHRRISFQHQDR